LTTTEQAWPRAYVDHFTWKDGDRIVRFGRGVIDSAGELLGNDFLLLTSVRAAMAAPSVTAAASEVLHVRAGHVDEIAAELLSAAQSVPGTILVGLGGGRVIDTAKALGAATGRVVGAIPTTLSGAEMTRVHRHVKGLTPPPYVRPRIVINDPDLSASQPESQLAASAANALAHAVDGAATIHASPVPRLAAAEAARLIAVAYAADEPDREALALAALLSGYTMDAARFGLHHVVSQTLAREAGIEHRHAHAGMLPHTMRALERRGIELIADPQLAEELARHAGATHLAPFGLDDTAVERCTEIALQRPELANTPPPANRDEILGLYVSAA
jgi:alcohol dehydrogenase class IV